MNLPSIFKRSATLRPFEDEFDKIFNDVFGEEFFPDIRNRQSYPKLNVYHKNDLLFIEASVGDIPKDKLEVKAENGILTIIGQAYQSQEVKEDDYFIREISRRSFQRSLKLPLEADIDKIQVKRKDGLLTISLPYKITKQNNIKKIDIVDVE